MILYIHLTVLPLFRLLSIFNVQRVLLNYNIIIYCNATPLINRVEYLLTNAYLYILWSLKPATRSWHITCCVCVPGAAGAAQAAGGGAAPGVPQVRPTHGPGHGLREACGHGRRPQASLLQQHRRTYRPRVSIQAIVITTLFLVNRSMAYFGNIESLLANTTKLVSFKF